MKVLVTGAKGFVGKNLCVALRNMADGKDKRGKYQSLLPLTVYEYDREGTQEELSSYCANADFVFNLAGINRPEDVSEFMKGNCNFGELLLSLLEQHGNRCPVMLSSSVQASLCGRYENSPYGESKLAAEEMFFDYAERTGATVLVFRFPNLYGKWSQPNYNSVVATFCDAIANNRDYEVNDSSMELELLYIDDLVTAMLDALVGEVCCCNYVGTNCLPAEGGRYCFALGAQNATLGEIVELLKGFREARDTHIVPNLKEGSFSKKLYSTFLSYYELGAFAYELQPNLDARGSFAEFLRTPERGQVSVNVSKPGITKGNHWHMSKWEKFLVVSGKASIKLRKVGVDAEGKRYPVDEYVVTGSDMRVVEMIPGYTHNITNLSESEDLVTVMWANESFDPVNPDTYFEEV